MITLYGIKNCDTMKKARTWLDSNVIAYTFHDYRVLGLNRPILEAWVTKVGWPILLNRSGNTFRKLPHSDKRDITETKAIDLMVAQPALIKRPVLDVDGVLTVGFKISVYEALFPL